MAQYLKEELRIKIIESAKNEFVSKGYEKASMRMIAKKSGMTAGNLYRYFDNKEQLYKYFVDPIMDEISVFLEANTKHHLRFDNRPGNLISKYLKIFNIKKEIEEPVRKFSQFFGKMVELHHEELQLLMTNLKNYSFKEGQGTLADWINDLIDQKLRIERKVIDLSLAEQTLSHVLTNAFFEGLSTMIAEYQPGMDIDSMMFEFMMMYVKMIQ